MTWRSSRGLGRSDLGLGRVRRGWRCGSLVGLAAVVVLTGCTGDGGSPPERGDPSRSAHAGSEGFAGRPAREIVAAAEADLASVRSVRVAGMVTSGGTRLRIDLRLDRQGGCAGSLGTAHGTVALRGTGGPEGRLWLRADPAYWRSVAGPGAAGLTDLVGDRWVAVSPGDPTFRGLCDADELLEQVLGGGGRAPAYVTVGTVPVDGSDAVRVDGTDADGGTTSRYVLLDAPHHLVRVERRGGEDPGTVTFSDFDVPVVVRAPAARRVVDLDRSP